MTHSIARQAAFRAVIESFLTTRCEAKLSKLAEDDPKHAETAAGFEPGRWLADAAHRVAQIQLVTHTLKATHPNARGSSLYCDPRKLAEHTELGSHALGQDFASDVTGNSGALDVYKFLRLQANNTSLLAALQAGDADLLAAFSNDAAEAKAWAAAFCELSASRGATASHALAKQVYWLNGLVPTEDQDYHLLAPLYASSLAQAVHQRINEDREAAGTARQARRAGQDHPQGYAAYPGLLVQKLGGKETKMQQNISQLNSERGGQNYLLASLPPRWQTPQIRRPSPRHRSIFKLWREQFPFWKQRELLKEFLRRDPAPIMQTRDHRDTLSDGLVEWLLMLARPLQDERPGWSTDADCRLPVHQQLWLDPWRGETDLAFRARWLQGDWIAAVSEDFGRWVNEDLRKYLPVGEVEHRHWVHELARHEAWLGELDRQRRQLWALEKQEAKEAKS